MRDDARKLPFGQHRVVVTSDIDEAHVALESLFLPTRMRLDERGTLDMTLNALRVGEVTVSYLRFGCAVHTAFVPDDFHVSVPLNGSADCRIGRMEPVVATPERGAVLMPGLPTDIDWSEGCAQFVLSFPRHAVRLELETMLDRPVTKPIEFASAMDVTTDHGLAWMSGLQLIERQAQCRHGPLDHPLAAGNLGKVLIHALVLAQPHNYTEALIRPGPTGAPSAVRKAINLIRSHPEQPWTTASLAHRVAMSPRSMQQGFQRSVGVPPMRYLREVRLDRVHQELQGASAGSVNVAQVARRWGFLYLGRFAASYAERFGETPSTTLRTP